MIEAIILSMSAFILGGIVGAFTVLNRKLGHVKQVKLNNGKSIYMWKGFVDPTKVYITVDTDNEEDVLFDGDLVVFNDEGHIIHVEKYDKA